MGNEAAELAFVATLRDEASAAAKSARQTLDSVTGATKPIETELKVRDNATRTLSSVNARLDEVSRKMVTTGRNLTRGITLPIIGAGVAIGKTSIEFSRGMGDVASLLPGNTKRVQQLRDEVMRIGPASGASLSETSRGLYQTLSAFGDTADTAKILEINAKGARAGAASVADAIALTSSVTKTYGDTTAKAVSKASDLALLTVRLGQTTFPELASSIGSVTPLTKVLGASQEELFATMATFSGVTGGAAEVSTQLRGALQSLMAPTADASAALKAAGYESGEALVKQKGLSGAITFLTDAAEKSGKPLASYISSIEGQTIALGLAGAQGKSYRKNLEEMRNAQGATNDAFKASTTGVGEAAFSWDKAQAEAEKLMVQLGDGLGPALVDLTKSAKPAAEFVAGLGRSFSQASPETQRLITAAILLAAALGPVLVVLGSIGRGVSGTISGITSVANAMGTLSTRARTTATDLGAAETRAAALGRIARGAAGAAGIGALAVGASSSSTALQVLGNVGGGALMGFAAGGPIGAAVGGTAGALLSLQQHASGAKDAAANSVPSWSTLAGTLDQVTGATTAATRAFIYDKLQRSQTLQLLNQYGIASRTVVDAVLGEKNARAQVSAAITSERSLRSAALQEAANLQQRYNRVVGSGAAEEAKRQAIAKLITAYREEAKSHGSVISGIRNGIGAVRGDTEATRKRANAVNDYDEILGQVKRRGRIVTYLETNGIPRNLKQIAAMQRSLRLTPKRIQTVMEALGIDVSRKRLRTLVADLERTNRTKGDLSGYARGVDGGVKRARDTANRGGRETAKNLEEPVRKAKADLGGFQSGVRSGSSSAAGIARTGGLSVGSSLKTGVISGFAGTSEALASQAASAVLRAIAAARAAAKSHSPSRKTMEVGHDLGRGLEVGLAKRARPLSRVAKRVVGSVLGVLMRDLSGVGADALGKSLATLEKRIGQAYDRRFKGEKNGRERANKATAAAIKGLRDEERALRKNAAAHDGLRAKLKEATDEGKAFAQSIRDYANVANVQTVNDAPVTAGFILSDLRTRLEAVRRYRQNLADLTKRGLDADLLAELRAGGVDAGGTAAAALMAASAAEFEAINATNRDLNKAAGDAGEESVAGLVKGLLSQLRAVDAAGAKIAQRLRKAVRRELGIRSPSRKLAQDGRNTGRGLGLGILDSIPEAEASARLLANRVAAAAIPSIPALAQLANRTALSTVAVRSSSVVTIRHEITSPDRSLDNLTASQVADLIARDPRAGRILEGALRRHRARANAHTISATD